MKDGFTVLLTIALSLILLAIGPFLVIVSVNGLAEINGWNVHIEHSIMNYIYLFILILVVRGGTN